MSLWTHALCDQCWRDLHPDGRRPVRVLAEPVSPGERDLMNESDFQYFADRCCRDGEPTRGIYWRHDGRFLPCRGKCSA